MPVRCYEVAKEFRFEVDGLDYPVLARIYRDTDHKASHRFHYEISHHYKPTKEAGGQYYPSKISGNTVDEVESLLMYYATGFTTIDVEPTEDSKELKQSVARSGPPLAVICRCHFDES